MRLVACLLVLIAGCAPPPAVALRPDVQPMGRQWVYRISDRQGKELGRIESKVVSVEGSKVVQETTETINGQSNTRQASATFQPDGSLLVEDGNGQMTPLPSVRRLLIPGATWVNPDGSQVLVEGQESVTVPAGTYYAYRLKLTKPDSLVKDWLYPSIGLIKEESEQAVIELMSVTGT